MFSTVPCLTYLILYDLHLGKALTNPMVLIIKYELMWKSMESTCDELRKKKTPKKSNKPTCYCLVL